MAISAKLSRYLDSTYCNFLHNAVAQYTITRRGKSKVQDFLAQFLIHRFLTGKISSSCIPDWWCVVRKCHSNTRNDEISFLLPWIKFYQSKRFTHCWISFSYSSCRRGQAQLLRNNVKLLEKWLWTPDGARSDVALLQLTLTMLITIYLEFTLRCDTFYKNLEKSIPVHTLISGFFEGDGTRGPEGGECYENVCWGSGLVILQGVPATPPNLMYVPV